MKKGSFCISLLLSFMIFGISLFAGTVKGRVLDDQGKPLANVKVEVLDTPISTQTEPDGIFLLEDMDKEKMFLTFSHPDYISRTIQVEVEKQTLITVKGIDKQKVGSVAAKLRSIRPPEPYKGKGIRYLGEPIRKKVGKTKA